MSDSDLNDSGPAKLADDTLKTLVDGFRHFRDDVFPEQEELFKRLAHAQYPQAMIITCADSRVVPDLITQASPGDLFVCRNVGNVVPPYGQMNGGVSTAIEYAVMALKVKHIIICGHSDCGAMKAVLDPPVLEKMPTVKSWLRHVETARTVVEHHKDCGCGQDGGLAFLTEENVIAQLDHLRTHPSVASGLASGQLQIHGWIYDIEKCDIKAYDASLGRFRALDSADPLPTATPRPRLMQQAGDGQR